MENPMRQTAGNFINYMISNLIFPLESQEHMGTGKDLWVLDWWVIEVAKYFFEGEVAYERYPIARRLGGNNNFKKPEIIKAGRERSKILEEMKSYAFDKVAVLENCRGFNTLLASTAKNWENIYVVIKSEHPVVVERTKLYLNRFTNVDVVGHFGVLGDPFYRMIVSGFDYQVSKGT